VRERMRSVFTRGLENHLSLEEMEPCRAIATRYFTTTTFTHVILFPSGSAFVLMRIRVRSTGQGVSGSSSGPGNQRIGDQKMEKLYLLYFFPLDPAKSGRPIITNLSGSGSYLGIVVK
jgi:hypothetical protein